MSEEPEQEEEEQTFIEKIEEIMEEEDDIHSWGLVWEGEEGAPYISWRVDDWGGASSIAIAAHSLYKSVIRNHHMEVARGTGSTYEQLQEQVSNLHKRVSILENIHDR